MSQNRKRRAAPDEIKENSDSKIPHLDDSPVDDGILEEIMGELKEMRTEIRENRKDIELKFEMLKMEMQKERLKQKEDSLNSKSSQFENSVFMFESVKEMKGELKEIKQNQEKIEQKIDQLKDENGKKLSELQTEILEKITTNQQLEDEKMDKISKELSSIREDVPRNIRREILGEWKMIEHEDFEGYKKIYPDKDFEWFSRNVKYSIEDGLLKQTGGSYKNAKEGENEPKHLRIFVEDNQVKTVTNRENIDRYIEDGRLHVIHHYKGEVWKRVYQKI